MSSAVSTYSSNNSFAIDLHNDGTHQFSVLDDDDHGLADAALTNKKKAAKNDTVSTAINMIANRAEVASATAGGGGSTLTKAAGSSTSGSAGGGASSAVTSSLAARGLSLTPTGVASNDGFTSESPNSRAALEFTGTPTLPEGMTHAAQTLRVAPTSTSTASATAVQTASVASAIKASGPSSISSASASVSTRAAALSTSTFTAATPAGQVQLSGSDLSSRLSDYMDRTGDGDAALTWESLMEMAKGAAQDEKDSADIKNAMQMGKVEEKKAEIKSTENQIEHERQAAAMNLMFAIAGAVVQMAGGVAGAMGGPAGTAMQAIGQALGPLIKSMGEYINKMSGPQAEADQDKINVTRHQMMQEVYEQAVDNAKSNYDEARDLLKLAIKVMQEHAERQTQISTTITRT